MHTCTVKYGTCCPNPQWCPSKPVLLLLTCLNHHMSKHTITAPMMSKMARNRSDLHDVLAQGASNRDTTVWQLCKVLYVFEHKTQYLLIHAPYTCIVVFWQISNIPPTRTPAFWGYPPQPHDYYWVILDPKSKEDKVKVTNLKNLPKFQNVEFSNKLYTRHTFWSCLIRCANMKWIPWALLKIQSGHDSVHRGTDGQGETSIHPFQLRWSRGYNDFKESNLF